MIADGSRGYVLPTVTGKHHDLKSITPTTLADVINGEYNDVINSYRIIDCRYPYEYEGGHVRGAENRYLHETILSLLQQSMLTWSSLLRSEFSSGSRNIRLLTFGVTTKEMMSSGFTGVESKFNWHMSAIIKSDSSEFWNKRLDGKVDN
jgi:hypothetical protein